MAVREILIYSTSTWALYAQDRTLLPADVYVCSVAQVAFHARCIALYGLCRFPTYMGSALQIRLLVSLLLYALAKFAIFSLLIRSSFSRWNAHIPIGTLLTSHSGLCLSSLWSKDNNTLAGFRGSWH